MTNLGQAGRLPPLVTGEKAKPVTDWSGGSGFWPELLPQKASWVSVGCPCELAMPTVALPTTCSPPLISQPQPSTSSPMDLLLAVDGRGWPWMAAGGRGWLWMAVGGHGWPWMAVDGRGWPWMATMLWLPCQPGSLWVTFWHRWAALFCHLEMASCAMLLHRACAVAVNRCEHRHPLPVQTRQAGRDRPGPRGSACWAFLTSRYMHASRQVLWKLPWLRESRALEVPSGREESVCEWEVGVASLPTFLPCGSEWPWAVESTGCVLPWKPHTAFALGPEVRGWHTSHPPSMGS